MNAAQEAYARLKAAQRVVSPFEQEERERETERELQRVRIRRRLPKVY